MKRITTLLIAAVMVTSCNINDDFDLTTLESDSISIGSSDSTFEAPLASVTVDFTSVVDESTRADDGEESSLQQYINNYGSLLPSSYEEEGLDLALITGDDEASEEYCTDMVGDLVDEANGDAEKGERLAELIYDNQSDIDASFTDELETTLGLTLGEVSQEDFVSAFVTEIQKDDSPLVGSIKKNVSALIQSEIANITSDIQGSDIKENVGNIDLPEDVLTMITDNLDGEGCTLRIFAKTSHNLPFEFDLNTPSILSNYGDVEITFFNEEGESERLVTSEITSDDLITLLQSMSIIASIDITKFLPSSGSSDDDTSDDDASDDDASDDESTEDDEQSESLPEYYVKFQIGMIKTGALTL